MLASVEGTSLEHKVGARIFRNAERVFQFHTAMRFTDKVLIEILDAMRTPGGKKLTREQCAVLNSLLLAVLNSLSRQTTTTSAIAGVSSPWLLTCLHAPPPGGLAKHSSMRRQWINHLQ